MEQDALKEKLLQKAMGYDYEEVTEEYVVENGEMKLSKRKVNKKHCPADNSALKALLENKDDEFEGLSEKQLIEEREKLLQEILKRRGK